MARRLTPVTCDVGGGRYGTGFVTYDVGGASDASNPNRGFAL